MAVNEKVSPFVFKLVITEKIHVTKYCDECKDLNAGNDDLIMPKLDLVLRAFNSFSHFDFDNNGNLSIYKRRSARLCFYWENKFQCVRNRVLTRYLDKFSRSKISEKKQNVHVILIKFWSEDVRRLVLQGRKMTDKFIKSLHNDTSLRFRSNELPMLCSSFKPTPFLHDCSNKYSCNNVLLWFGIHVYHHFGSIRFVAASISVWSVVDVSYFTVLGLDFQKCKKCNFMFYSDLGFMFIAMVWDWCLSALSCHFALIRFVVAIICVCSAVDICYFTVLRLDFQKFTKCNFMFYSDLGLMFIAMVWDWCLSALSCHFALIRFVVAIICVCSEVDLCSFTVLGLEFEKLTKCNFNEYLVWFGSSGCVKEIIGFGLLNILIKNVDDSLSVSNWSCTTKYLRHVFLSIVSYLLMYVILIVLMENWFYEPP